MYKTFLICLSFLLGRVELLDNGLALTPPKGWLSWQRFRCITDCELYPNDCLSEELIMTMADLMADNGFLEAGYEYIIVDDCWASKTRDKKNKLFGDPERFPSGMKALADYVHSKGLKFGIYGDYGNYTCGGYPGSIDFLELDAKTFAEWGVDYLKLDGCYAELEGMEEGYGKMTQYLNNTGRPIVYSCSFPAYKELDTNYSAAVEYCNLWRNYGDIQDTFEDVKDIANWFSENQDYLRPFAGPGHWNDPDMLLIGNYGLSVEQSKTQMTIWVLMAAPLIMSVDLRTIRPEFTEILLNPIALSISNDPLGEQGYVAFNESSIITYIRKLEKNGPKEPNQMAIGFISYRVDGYPYRHNFTLSSIGVEGNKEYEKFLIQDAFDGIEKVVGLDEELEVRLPPSGAVLWKLVPKKG